MNARKFSKYEKRESYVDGKGRVRTRYVYGKYKKGSDKYINPINMPYDKAYSLVTKRLADISRENASLRDKLADAENNKKLDLVKILDGIMAKPFLHLDFQEIEVLRLLVAANYIDVTITQKKAQKDG
jgi:hypothetical protein